MKVIAFGVREPEKKIFTENNTYGYSLSLQKGSLSEKNCEVCQGFDAVIVRASDQVNKKVVETLTKKHKIKYLLTRTAGVNHLDLEALKKCGVLCANAPGYSPSSISELAFSTAFALSRKVFLNSHHVFTKKYLIKDNYCAKEIRNTTVGIIGVGKIGSTTCKLFKNVGAKVYGFDLYPQKQYEPFCEYVELNYLLQSSDVVVLHMNYVKGQNDDFINKGTISKMKEGVILVNAARGELMNDEDVYQALIEKKLFAVGTDVLKNEKLFFNKKDGKPNEIQQKLISLYPRFVLTTHIGSFTHEAIRDMVLISYENLNDFVTKGTCKNQI